ncbi:error-prone DNA polymerase [Pusillimonas noertemannii]|uniref:Error-prone DNA polymerase n=1 Tax=Pusillimonas noertemannii TaxID=305977 RepID=A0A2U1CHS2_9BURK|nr:error-prone DNA polymerase [Pusillimonas noertemannii]NYT70323.1 error-prone DNA polymerase [Pusillimonas noertemannii]PVY60464.1 error-prone DNA polymerase [Pusillimonas noertemannii]TFL08040.1 error-prone DNA polymerase [Pusillimonas noertemannii]
MQPDTLPDYAELDCISNFSFLSGASHPYELVRQAAKLGYSALALADECSVAGVVRAYIESLEHSIHLIVGSRFRLDTHGPDELHIVALARNDEGYANLAELITLARTRSTPKGQYQLSLQDILEPPRGFEHLRGLPGCAIIFKPAYGIQAEALRRQLQRLLPAFPEGFWLGLTLHHRQDDARHAMVLQQAAQEHGLRITATGEVHMHSRSRQPLHDTLTAIRLRTPIAQCGYALASNAEPHLRSRLRLLQLYPPQALEETLAISRLCRFDLNRLKDRYQYPRETVPQDMTPAQYLRQETYKGARERYPRGIPSKVQDQLEEELNIIATLRYEPYFLTVYDIVRFARSQGILCQGRGSAANSAVCYCLRITEVNPDNGNALFARFISAERNEPPDIDVDFEHQRREEVIQHIYEYYGRKRAALTAVVITYRARSALRDTGKALGVELDLIEKVTKSCRHWDGKGELIHKMAEQGLDPDSRLARQWAALAQDLRDFPRHLSQHPGGFVLADDNLARLVPIENAAMPGRSVVQWDKDDLDALKIMKVDVLALGMLSALNRMLAMVTQRRGRRFTLGDIPAHDEPTFEMIRQADTIGVFQIESRAQMSMLPRLKPKVFYDLVVQVAIVRPGPIQGGMVHPYLRRRKGEPFDAPAGIKKILERTLGVPIFQEQAMQIAIDAGGFSPGEADELRRSMAAWRRKGGIGPFHAKLVNGMKAKGYDQDYAEAIFKQLEGFGEYGFPESHSASFAKLAYFSAWFKRHEPEAFLAALLNSQPMGFYSSSQLVQDARRHGVQVLPVDVTTSGWETCLVPPDGGLLGKDSPSRNIGPPSDSSLSKSVPGNHESLNEATLCDDEARKSWVSSEDAPRPAVRLGFNQIKGFSKETGLRIQAARQDGPLRDQHDLALRAGLERADLERLAGADALRQLSGHRRQAQWQAANPPLKGLLRDAPVCETEFPSLERPTEGSEILADYHSTQLTLRRHPLALLRRLPELRPFASAAQLQQCPDGRLARACGLVTMRQRPQTANGIIFVSLEDETGIVNVVVRPPVAERQRIPLLQSRLMGVHGVWQQHEGICHLMAGRLIDMSALLGTLPARSRNFH